MAYYGNRTMNGGGDYGLTEHEAKKRLLKYGYNQLESKRRKSPVILFMEQFNDLMIWILIAATVVSALMGEVADAVTILIIVVMNAILGFIQEYRTEKSMEELKKLSSPMARVIRDGKVKNINAIELVCGDIILLESGDIIPADSIILSGNGIQSDEALLTGESVAADKAVYRQGDNVSPSNKIYMGCSITKGNCHAKVISTGMNTEMGKIAQMLKKIDDELTPLQIKLQGLGKILVYSCLILCGIVTLTGIVKGEEPYKMFLVGVSLAVAAIPEGLPAIVTISLALGIQRMIKKNVLIRKLPAVETLGCTQVICSDKTGTLTQNKMTVKEAYIPNMKLEATGEGYNVDGKILHGGMPVKMNEATGIRLLLENFIVCNNSSVNLENGLIKVVGDPTEIALLVLGLKGGLTSNAIKSKYKLIEEHPFDSERKMMSVLCENNTTRYLFVKGAPEYILANCNRIMIDGKETLLTQSWREKIEAINNGMTSSALRVIGGAYKVLDAAGQDKKEDRLIFLGLCGMIDPPKRDAIEAIVSCKLAGITPVMITGDHKQTAYAVASQLKMLNKDSLVLEGAQLDKMSDEELLKILPKVRIFARVSPSHKYRIVKGFKKLGLIAAMTGDGVNDAPAIKEADIGIAMGINGTGVTKEASSMILLDDNFSSIVAAVGEGRVIYDNIRKFIRYLLSCNLGEVLTMFFASLLNLPLPLLPIQILLINLATDGLPAMALSLEPPEKDIMIKRPRGRNESIFSEGLWAKIVLRGVMIGLCTIIAFSMSLVFSNGDIVLSRTVALCTLVMSQLFHVFECRSERNSILTLGIFTNMYLVFAVLTSLFMLLLVIYFPYLRGIFSAKSLNFSEWMLVLALSGIISLISNLIWHKK